MNRSRQRHSHTWGLLKLTLRSHTNIWEGVKLLYMPLLLEHLLRGWSVFYLEDIRGGSSNHFGTVSASLFCAGSTSGTAESTIRDCSSESRTSLASPSSSIINLSTSDKKFPPWGGCIHGKQTNRGLDIHEDCVASLRPNVEFTSDSVYAMPDSPAFSGHLLRSKANQHSDPLIQKIKTRKLHIPLSMVLHFQLPCWSVHEEASNFPVRCLKKDS